MTTGPVVEGVAVVVSMLCSSQGHKAKSMSAIIGGEGNDDVVTSAGGGSEPSPSASEPSLRSTTPPLIKPVSVPPAGASPLAGSPPASDPGAAAAAAAAAAAGSSSPDVQLETNDIQAAPAPMVRAVSTLPPAFSSDGPPFTLDVDKSCSGLSPEDALATLVVRPQEPLPFVPQVHIKACV
jgi:hypothetical protein